MASAERRDAQAPGMTEFEIRRANLIGEIAVSLEGACAQINALNRSLEGIIEIGNEFASVEALWSQFETVMGRENGDGVKEGSVEGHEGEEDDGPKQAS